MIKVLFMFPDTVASEEADDIVSKYILPANKQSPGFRSMNTSVGALLSPGGPVPWERIVEANFDSFDGVVAAAKSSIVEMAEPRMKALGVKIVMFEVGAL